MSKTPLVSIIVNNYNYGKFIKEAIDSALKQSYENLEVIVVDDGSTDNSREIIKNYGNKIIPIFKENGGQASAFNAGFSASKGELIIFLDSDDILLPECVSKVVEVWSKYNCIKIHWPLAVVDINGTKTGEIVPRHELPEGDMRQILIDKGPASFVNPPTTGNAWSRKVLEEVFPIPESTFRICADAYLFTVTPLFGEIKKITSPLGLYRIHGNNNWHSKNAINIEKVKNEVKIYEIRCEILAQMLKKQNINMDKEFWINNNWYRIAKKLIYNRLIYKFRGRTIGFLGIKATCASEKSLIKKAILSLWFLLMIVSPKPIAKKMAEMFITNME